MKKLAMLAATIAAIATAASPALAQGKSSGRKAQERGVAEIPVCQKKLGTISIVEPDNNWWQAMGLGSPEAILKLFVMKSGCFGLVDRNKGLASRNIERALADNGELQGGSNIGRGQVKAADYFIVPDIVSKNEKSGGGGLGGILGGIGGRMGGFGALAGGIAGGLSVSKKEANVMLTLVNSRTTEQERMTEGYARKSDWSFGGGAGGFWGGGLAGVGGQGYQNTDIGQVLVLAYLDAYRNMVTQLGGLPVNPSAAAPQATR
ncbi:MAG TPA: CsgG/HfaB family protein [Allosphingosinicella sp.]|jgi:curli biogenesis system outer membrane secretion channel CsgG